MKKNSFAIIMASVVTTGVVIAPTSMATSENNPAIEGVNPDESPISYAKPMKYGDKDVLKLILFAQGPIAERNPELAQKLLKGKPKPQMPSEEAFDSVVDQLKRVDPDYHELVTEGVQRNNPQDAENAMQRLSDDLSKIYELEKKPDQERGVTTWAWHDAHVVIETEALGAAAVVVFEAAAAAHVAAVVIAIVPAAASYQFEFNNGSQIDRQQMVATVSQILRS